MRILWLSFFFSVDAFYRRTGPGWGYKVSCSCINWYFNFARIKIYTFKIITYNKLTLTVPGGKMTCKWPIGTTVVMKWLSSHILNVLLRLKEYYHNDYLGIFKIFCSHNSSLTKKINREYWWYLKGCFNATLSGAVDKYHALMDYWNYEDGMWGTPDNFTIQDCLWRIFTF